MTARAQLSATPLGSISVTVEGRGITRLTWGEDAEDAEGTPAENHIAEQALNQLTEYFAGRRRCFDLPLEPAGSEHQQRVWRALCDIPYGQTQSYGQLAQRVGSVARAVGGACGANPIAIVIPCHRVLGGKGAMTGFSAGGGLDDKRFLLALERGEPALPFA